MSEPTPPLDLGGWVSNAGFGFGALDASGCFEYLNETFVRYLGYAQNELVGLNAVEILDSTNQRIYEEHFEARKNGSSDPYRLKFSAAGRSSFECVLAPSPRFGNDGDFQGSMGFALPKESSLITAMEEICRPLLLGPAAPPRHLTNREGEVYRLLVEGRSAKAISETLEISVHTVRNHLRSIYAKCEVHSQMELIASVGKRGMVRGSEGPETRS